MYRTVVQGLSGAPLYLTRRVYDGTYENKPTNRKEQLKKSPQPTKETSAWHRPRKNNNRIGHAVAPCSEQHTRSRLRMPSNLMFFPIFVSSFFYLILDSIPFFPPFFLFFSFFSFSFFSFFFSFLDTEYNPTSTPPEPAAAAIAL